MQKKINLSQEMPVDPKTVRPFHFCWMVLWLSVAGKILAFASVGNAVGSVVIGYICDRIGSLKTCYAMIGLGFITFCYGLVTSDIMVLSPFLTMDFYGKGDYEKVYAKVIMGAPLASILLEPAYGFVYDATKSYSKYCWLWQPS